MPGTEKLTERKSKIVFIRFLDEIEQLASFGSKNQVFTGLNDFRQFLSTGNLPKNHSCLFKLINLDTWKTASYKIIAHLKLNK